MIKLKGNILTTNKTRLLTKKHLYNLKKIEKYGQLRVNNYMESLLGRKSQVSLTHRYEQQLIKDSMSDRKNKIINMVYDIKENGYVDHKPYGRSSKSKWIGVEIECYIEGFTFEGDSEYCDLCECDREECGCSDGNEIYYDLKYAISAAGIKRCSVRPDGSLEDGGLEICLLFNSARSFKPLMDLCKILNDFGATVNASCGLHVHIDQYNLTEMDIAHKGSIFEDFLPILMLLQPESRRENNYCIPQASFDEKYSAINLSSFRKHSTIEIRLHTGSTNYEKISNWIKLLSSINEQYGGSRLLRPVRNVLDLSKHLGLTKELTEFYQKRFKDFNEIDDNCIDENEQIELIS